MKSINVAINTNCIYCDNHINTDSFYIPLALWCGRCIQACTPETFVPSYFCAMTQDQVCWDARVILTLSLGWECEANHNTILPAMNMMCNSPIPSPHPRPHSQATSQATFPGPIPRPHPRPHPQATFPGHIPRPHSQATWETEITSMWLENYLCNYKIWPLLQQVQYSLQSI